MKYENICFDLRNFVFLFMIMKNGGIEIGDFFFFWKIFICFFLELKGVNSVMRLLGNFS